MTNYSTQFGLLPVFVNKVYWNIATFIHILSRSTFILHWCPTLRDPIDGSPPGSPIPGILQARTLEWFAISFSNTTLTEFSKYKSDHIDHKGWNIYYLALYRKNLPISCINCFHIDMCCIKKKNSKFKIIFSQLSNNFWV